MNYEHRETNYYKKLASYYKKLFDMLYNSIECDDKEEQTKVKTLMEASNYIN